MIRDMDLVRKILIDIENLDFDEDYTVNEQDFNEIRYHLKILGQAGFIPSKQVLILGEKYGYRGLELTWQGHEFLDTIRNESVWTKLKSTLGKEVSTVPIKVITTIATKLTSEIFLDKFGLK